MSGDRVVWARPLPRGPFRTALIECCIEMCADRSGDYLSAHAVFASKVLREPWLEALAIAVRFRSTPLTSVEDCEALADEWWEPS